MKNHKYMYKPIIYLGRLRIEGIFFFWHLRFKGFIYFFFLGGGVVVVNFQTFIVVKMKCLIHVHCM